MNRTRPERRATSSGDNRLWFALPAGVAICGAVAFLSAGGATPPPSDPRVCWVSSGPSHFAELDQVDNLETCGARLEAVYRLKPRPLRGAYGGVFVFVDAKGIDAAAPNGPRTRLLSDQSRTQIDKDIDVLLALQQSQATKTALR